MLLVELDGCEPCCRSLPDTLVVVCVPSWLTVRGLELPAVGVVSGSFMC
jgi:hypothetical protein